MKQIERLWLVEWQYKSSGDAESTWPGKWEPDHNSGIWFSRAAALAMKRKKELDPGFSPYRFRVAPWVRPR